MKSLKQEVLEEFYLLEKEMINKLKKEIDLLSKENNDLKHNLINKEILINSLSKNTDKK